MLDHPWSSTPGLLLLPRSLSLPAMPHLSPAHSKISKHNSPHKIDRVEPPKLRRFEFNPGQANYSSQSNQGTGHLVSISPLKNEMLCMRSKLGCFTRYTSKYLSSYTQPLCQDLQNKSESSQRDHKEITNK
jgi:hypothetical protein